ncbi:peroxiredoxin [[Mycoplasma] mobile]|uniref:Peroxiredoxin n=1 Tax=Mycoplasma mobile (strain ATCC 43663 / 163K / NCTC 11711) TaxID=267748 RepID=Q6KHC1_MYCM1|nr:peroxiredoxin [[Mycoplasma] mobile]AAT28009.1 peroxiredoxin [Mycoplasma mobile 163K]
MNQVILFGKEYDFVNLFDQAIKTIKPFTLIDSKFQFKSFSSFEKKTIFLTLPFLQANYVDFFTKNLLKLSSEFMNFNFVVLVNENPLILNKWESLIEQKNVRAFSDFATNTFSKSIGIFIDKLGFYIKTCFIINENFKIIYQDIVFNLHDEINFKKLEVFLKTI